MPDTLGLLLMRAQLEAKLRRLEAQLAASNSKLGSSDARLLSKRSEAEEFRERMVRAQSCMKLQVQWAGRRCQVCDMCLLLCLIVRWPRTSRK